MALSSELRSALDKAIVAARDAAEEASAAALGVLAVDAERAHDSFDEDKRRLRVALRAEARQLGGFERLVEECAYEQWHRMLFARFLAENDLLIHPEHGVPVTLDDCEEIAHARGESDLWLVASELASAMLPGIFRSDDPVLQLTLAPEGQQRLEEILANLPREVFASEDGLGWVYQYWQSKKKKEVNASERKIGGADIAPVTQLFTENYMVRFLLENTLGAWWASRNPASPLMKEWEYLRFDEEGKPAAASFPGWPETVAQVTVMDPCCGSGHFLVVAFEMLRKMRMEAEGLSAADAGDAVLRDNLFGLELDPRCTQIAAFALALQAWKTGGYRELPIPNIACSGISAKGKLEDWKKLAKGDERLERSLERLHALFSDAGDLGSLIDPRRETSGELLVAEYDEVSPLLDRALGRETTKDPSAEVFGAAVRGAFRAARLLANTYSLVVTNVPYLTRIRHGSALLSVGDRSYSDSKSDLATMFLVRLERLAGRGGTYSLVSPQNWLFLTWYRRLRERLLDRQTLNFVARVGEHGFSSAAAAGAFVCLTALSEATPLDDHAVWTLDAGPGKNPDDKRVELQSAPVGRVRQSIMRKSPDSRVLLKEMADAPLLSEFAVSSQGICTGDYQRFGRKYWEFPRLSSGWEFQQSTVTEVTPYGGREHVLYWEDGAGTLVTTIRDRLGAGGESAWIRGTEHRNAFGVAIAQTRYLRPTLFTGGLIDNNVAVIIPRLVDDLPAIWAYCTSPEYFEAVREMDAKLNVTGGTLIKVPFDRKRWTAVAAELYPHGLPKPSTDSPTQWTASGMPLDSKSSLHVAVSRLCGFRWPRQTGSEFPDCPALGPDGLERFADEDGIICIPSVRGERPASERLRALLAAAFGDEWSSAREADLLAEVGYAGKSLEQWLRDGFFDQHSQLFHQRPFVWQVWDGMKDGFSALVNYHRLDRPNLEKLVYTYLGEWIRQQRESAAAGTPGADLRLAAAAELRGKLELILEGDDPYDIFVRWKPLEEQPIGWEPDLNDGVRLNIRPFVTAGVLRKDPKIKWGKDRGKDPESAPWYAVFKGDRVNDHHLTLAEKRAARERSERRAAAS